MRIGLTYDLRQDYLDLGWSLEDTAEFDSEETVAAIEGALRGLGHGVTRIGSCTRLAEALVAGNRWDLVFNIAEGFRGRSREAQVPALLETYGLPYTMCDPCTAALTLDKALAKRVIRDHGLPTPDFCVVESEHEVRTVDLPFPLFVKPVAEGTGKGVTSRSLVRNPRDLQDVCRGILARPGQQVLIERYLPGDEVTVGILGTGAGARALGVMEVVFKDPSSPAGIYSQEVKEHWEHFVEYRIVEDRGRARDAADLAVAAYRVLGCRDVGRVDLKADDLGRWSFLEVNPLPGLHPTHSDLPILCGLIGLDFTDLIGEIVSSASRRMKGRTG